mmetsp:Transcript_19641/g.42317  ORF Transcript_19641/g.42317 Transcript_19641/m.42317 type:complete len:92 (-) Transcript_19641:283-558(-)
MGPGVEWFTNPTTQPQQTNVESVVQGEPFKPCKAMLHKFLSAGGLVLACTTCVLHRRYTFERDMMECVTPMQMPDLIQYLSRANGNTLQFS